MIEKSKVVLVTTTFSKTMDDIRAQLALKTCWAAHDHGYKILVIDGSPCEEFKAALWKADAIVFNQKIPGMGQSRREALEAGLDTGADVIVWLEPEKYPLVPLLEPCIQPFLHPIHNGEAHIVIPRRRNLDGYPQYQHLSELRANWEIANITGRGDLDYFYGPRIMNRWAAEKMMAYDGTVDGQKVYEDNWEILFIPVLWFIAWGMPIKSVIVDYVHPSEQLTEDDEEMRGKRDKQRIDLVAAMQKEAKRLNFTP